MTIIESVAYKVPGVRRVITLIHPTKQEQELQDTDHIEALKEELTKRSRSAVYGKLGRDFRIPTPSTAEVKHLDNLKSRGVSGIDLVYLPSIDLTASVRSFPDSYRMPGVALEGGRHTDANGKVLIIEDGALRVQAGWRFVETVRPRLDDLGYEIISEYENDHLARALASLRREGRISRENWPVYVNSIDGKQIKIPLLN